MGGPTAAAPSGKAGLPAHGTAARGPSFALEPSGWTRAGESRTEGLAYTKFTPRTLLQHGPRVLESSAERCLRGLPSYERAAMNLCNLWNSMVLEHVGLMSHI